MVQLKFLKIFLFIMVECAKSELLSEESKLVKIRMGKVKSGAAKPFQCDLNLMSEQKELMYSESKIIKTSVSFDSYNWPKTSTGHVIVPYHISRSSHYCE